MPIEPVLRILEKTLDCRKARISSNDILQAQRLLSSQACGEQQKAADGIREISSTYAEVDHGNTLLRHDAEDGESKVSLCLRDLFKILDISI